MATTTAKRVRETAAARRERVAQEEAVLVEQGMAEARAAWPARLMSMLERATAADWEISVKEGKFIVKGQKVTYSVGMVPTGTHDIPEVWGTYDSQCWSAMADLEAALDESDRELAEATRRSEIRKTALSKLTPTERAELGL